MVVVSLQLLFNMHTANAMRKRFFPHRKELLTVNHKSAETKSFDGVTYINLAEGMDLMQVANYMVSKKSEKKEYSDQFLQSSNWILCINKYVCVYLIHISPQFISSKSSLDPVEISFNKMSVLKALMYQSISL